MFITGDHNLMAKRENEFREDDKIKVLLWCDRHCCLCGKPTGVGIEIAHLDTQRSDIDNAIPLCFDCHAAIGLYNPDHPLGLKHRIKELKARRNQIYEQYTRHLVPPVRFAMTQENRVLPDVGFHITNLGNSYPIQARVEINIVQGVRSFGHPGTRGHYDGTYIWNLNPGFGVAGYFKVPQETLLDQTQPLRARIDVTLIDIYERSHRLLPVGYILDLQSECEWYFEPAEEELSTVHDPAA
jgi:hypothetical protein